jgi:multicomponent Na+:H+ antiporter subunit F
MTTFFYASALFILLNIAASLYRILAGPSREDRMMGGQLIGTGGVAVLVLLSMVQRQEGVLDVALLLALLAAFAAVGFVKSVSAEGCGDPEAEG